jgi:hypothetical protein
LDKKITDLGLYMLNVCLLYSSLSQTLPNKLVAAIILIISKLVTNSINFSQIDLEKELKCDAEEIKLKAKDIVEWIAVYEN